MKIAEQISWPSVYDSSSFTIAVMEDEDLMYDQIVQQCNYKKQLFGRNFKVVVTDKKEVAYNSDLVYLSPSYYKIAESIYAVPSEKCPLIVTDESPELYFSMINLQVNENNVRFQVNKANLTEKGFSITDKLLLLGGSEVDIRVLYVKAQEQLKIEHEKLKKEQERFRKLQNKIHEKEDVLVAKEMHIDTLRAAIDSIAGMLKQEQVKLRMNRSELVNLNRLYKEKTDKLKQQEVNLAKLEEQVRKERQEIEFNSQTIDYLNESINKKRLLLAEQDEMLFKQGKQLNNSRIIIYIVSIFSAILLLLVVLFIRMNQYKRRTNRKLKLLNENLQSNHQHIYRQNTHIEKQNEVLAFQNKRLDEANKTKDKFFSIIAHDLKNPVNSIKGFAELLVTRRGKIGEEKQFLFQEQIADASRNLSTTLENLLDWARSQTGKINVSFVPLSVGDIIERNLKFLEPQANKKNIHIITEFDKELMVEADSNMVDTILRNLISNAIKFSYRGNNVVLNCRKHGENKVMFSVIDYGPGISEENQKQLFNFTNMHSSPGTENEMGTGLGLTVCYEFVQQHNGELTVKSVEGKGTVFSFTIPSSVSKKTVDEYK